MDVILFRTFSHKIIMTWKVDPHTEKGAKILTNESPIKVIDGRRDSEKSYRDKTTFLKIFNHLFSMTNLCENLTKHNTTR